MQTSPVLRKIVTDEVVWFLIPEFYCNNERSMNVSMEKPTDRFKMASVVRLALAAARGPPTQQTAVER